MAIFDKNRRNASRILFQILFWEDGIMLEESEGAGKKYAKEIGFQLKTVR